MSIYLPRICLVNYLRTSTVNLAQCSQGLYYYDLTALTVTRTLPPRKLASSSTPTSSSKLTPSTRWCGFCGSCCLVILHLHDPPTSLSNGAAEVACVVGGGNVGGWWLSLWWRQGVRQAGLMLGGGGCEPKFSFKMGRWKSMQAILQVYWVWAPGWSCVIWDRKWVLSDCHGRSRCLSSYRWKKKKKNGVRTEGWWK